MFFRKRPRRRRSTAYQGKSAEAFEARTLLSAVMAAPPQAGDAQILHASKSVETVDCSARQNLQQPTVNAPGMAMNDGLADMATTGPSQLSPRQMDQLSNSMSHQPNRNGRHDGGKRVPHTPPPPAPTPSPQADDYRSIDGTGNNLQHPEWGSTDEQLLRTVDADYADGISAPAGEDRPSAREISNLLAAHDDESVPNDRGLSAFLYVWGQFIDHGIDLTSSQDADGEQFPVDVPAGDADFDPTGTGTQTIGLTRSLYDESTGTSTDNPRQQITQVTSWIDGSQVYGSDAETAASLREFEGGRLRMSEGELLPTDAQGNFLAGDIRVEDNPELTAIQTLFAREHNTQADRIGAQHPNWSDEQIYQEARKIVIAEIQSITYNEFLPSLLGTQAMPEYQGYQADVDPSIANEFSTAAYRFGHTTVNEDVEFFGDDGLPVADEISLREAFFNPTILQENGIDSILKYVASSTSEEVDLQVVDSLRNFLFGEPGQGGFDLVSLNIQRGRDHGLADYNTVRQAYGLDPVSDFSDITSDPQLQQDLKSLYGSVDDIDLWVGGLAEDHAAGSSVGPLFQTIIADQFNRLRAGDRYWYQNTFSGRELQTVEQTTLADVMRRNTTITNLQDDVFFMQARVSGKVFADANHNGQANRHERGAANVTVQLIDDEGEVIATTQTDRQGRYTFDSFHETGSYQLQILAPQGAQLTTPAVQSVLISRGGLDLNGFDFGLQFGRPAKRRR